MFTLDELKDAARVVHAVMPPTPQYAWPLLNQLSGLDLIVKHENHTPTGAFKVRGGIVYFDALVRGGSRPAGVISATRGNHGQSVAFGAARAGVPATIVVPHGNSAEKNAAMRAFGAELIEHGQDFDEAKAHAQRLAGLRGLAMVPSYDPLLVRGVATYALEMFTAHPRLARVYVPIGLGSGITGVILTRDLLRLECEVIGVVSEEAPAYALSYQAGRIVATNSARTFADGVAVREPSPVALEILRRGAARVVRVSDDEIAQACRVYYEACHNLAEGAGAAALAAALKERAAGHTGQAAVILTGGNIDGAAFARILAGATPSA